MERDDISYTVSYRTVKYPRLEFKTGELVIVLPLGQKPDSVFENHKIWIHKKLKFINEYLEKAKKKKLTERTEKEFRELVFFCVEEISEALRVEPNNIFFRKMKTKWASISAAKNLTLNKLMIYLPAHLIKYVIFHEMTKIKKKRHNEKFLNIISQRYKNYEQMERGMFIYWFLIVKKIK